MAAEAVSTVFIAGFPPDATERELDNLCRFMPGFVDSKVDSRRGACMLFVLFDAPHQARTALTALNGKPMDRKTPGEPMRANLARSNMRAEVPASAWVQPPPPTTRPPRGTEAAALQLQNGGWGDEAGGAPGKRPRIPEDPGNIDTVASIGAAEAGFDEEALQGFFYSLRGFVAFKPNPRMGGGFAKFETPALAAAALRTARENGVPAEMARSSMGTPAGAAPAAPQAAHAPVYAPAQASAPAGGPRRPRIPEEPGNIDTVASIGAAEAGLDATALEGFFASLPGFVTFKENPRMGGGFAKFESSELAANAVAAAQESGVPAEMARSSMGAVAPGAAAPVPAAAPGPPPEQQGGPRRPRIYEDPGQVDTVASVGAAEAGLDQQALEEYFAALPGFVAFKANSRMGGGFAKFASHDFARQAIEESMKSGVPASLAKSSMSTTS